jgi:hypothetical protein
VLLEMSHFLVEKVREIQRARPRGPRGTHPTRE